MASSAVIPSPPPGFVLDTPQIPPPPDGFVLDQVAAMTASPKAGQAKPKEEKSLMGFLRSYGDLWKQRAQTAGQFAEDAYNAPYRGLTESGLGMIQGVNALLPKRPGTDDLATATAQATKNVREAAPMQTTVGQILPEFAKPQNWIIPPTIRLAGAGALPALGNIAYGTAAGAGLGGLTGFLNPSEAQSPERQLQERTGAAKTGATLGGALGPLFTAVPEITNAVVGNTTSKRADKWANQYVAKKLMQEGVTPEELAANMAQAQAAGTGETLAEAAQSPTLLSRQKLITKGSGRNARDAQQFFQTRGDEVIPQAAEGAANAVKQTADEAGPLFDEIIARNPSRDVYVNDMASGVRKVSSGVKADDILSQAQGALKGTYADTTERGVMRDVVDLLKQAQQRGNSFGDLHAVKSQIGKIYQKYENADAARQAKGLAGKYYTMLSDRLATVEPEYAVAEKLYRQKLAADDIIAKVKATNDGNTGTLYNRLFGNQELRDDLAKELGPEHYKGLEALMDSLKRIKKGGMGGSDTAFNLGGAAEYAAERGSPLGKAAEKPTGLYQQTIGRFGQWLNATISAGDDAALMRVLTNPDMEKLGKLMQKHAGAGDRAKDTLVANWLKTRGGAFLADEAGSVPLGGGSLKKFDLTAGGRPAREGKIGPATISYTMRDGMRGEPNYVHLDGLFVPKDSRKGGWAKMAMKRFLDETDAQGLPVYLTAEPLEKTVSRQKLENFYKSLGFLPNEGENPAAMVRLPPNK